MDLQRLKKEYDDSCENGELHELVRRHIIFEEDKQGLLKEIEKKHKQINQICGWQRGLESKIKTFRAGKDERAISFDKTVGIVRWDDRSVQISKMTLERAPKE